jgi:uncharacterized protein (TIGR02300 family)
MATKAATPDVDIKAQRGTKRTCQNPECGSRFYDLNRDPITCPVCSTVYAIPVSLPGTATEERAKRPEAKKRVAPVAAPKPEDAPEAEGDELIIEGEDEAVEAEADDTMIEEVEEDSPDVTRIIDAPIEDTDEKS